MPIATSKRLIRALRLTPMLAALVVATPVAAQTDIEMLKQQVAEQRRILDQQQKMLDEQQKVIDRLEQQAAGKATSPPTEGVPVAPEPAPSKPLVEIYGTLYPLVENIAATGATGSPPESRPNQLPAPAYTGADQGRRTRLTLGSSNIGFRGSVDVTGSFSAWWQVEAGAAIDGDSSGIGGTNVLGLRNSAVGLSGPFGTALVGNWDTPYKWAALFSTALPAGQNFDDNSLIGNPGFGVFGTTTLSTRVNGKADAAFDRRQGNSVQYWTPTWNGLAARFAYSFAEGKSASTSSPVIAPEVFSAAVSYENKPLVLRYTHEQHNDYFGMSQIGGAAPSATNVSSKDVGDKIVGSYSIGDTSVSAIYERLGYSNDDTGAETNVRKYRRDAFYVTAEQKFAVGKLWLSYGKTSDGSCSTVGNGECTTSGLGATEWVVGFVHKLNKYVELYAVYYDIRNRESGTYQPVSAVNVPANGMPAPGLNIQSFGAGMFYAF